MTLRKKKFFNVAKNKNYSGRNKNQGTCFIFISFNIFHVYLVEVHTARYKKQDEKESSCPQGTLRLNENHS